MRKRKVKQTKQDNGVWADYNGVHCLNCRKKWMFRKEVEPPDAKTFICPICCYKMNKEKAHQNDTTEDK